MHKYQLIVMIFFLLSALSGCAKIQEAENLTNAFSTGQAVSITEESNSPKQKLCFSVVEAESPGYTLVSGEELGGKTDTYIAYDNLEEVNLTLDGTTVSLAEAIREEALTVPELSALARMDARSGFCEETYVSHLGLTHFVYTYPECELWIAYDVYETPDGTQTLIDEIYVRSISGTGNIDFTYVDKDSEWGYFIDREDWGLIFEVSSVSPTQITVDYTQCQAQEIGELILEDYTMFSNEDSVAPEYLYRSKKDTDGLPTALLSDSAGQITIDWSDTLGPLKPGAYYIRVTVSDNYVESNVPPLMRNYYDRQSYHIVFTIV